MSLKRQDYLISSASVVWTELATIAYKFSVVLNMNSFVQSCLRRERICELSKYDVTTGNCKLETGSGQDKTSSHCISRLFHSFQSPTVLTCRQFSSQDSLVLSAVWTSLRALQCNVYHYRDKGRATYTLFFSGLILVGIVSCHLRLKKLYTSLKIHLFKGVFKYFSLL